MGLVAGKTSNAWVLISSPVATEQKLRSAIGLACHLTQASLALRLLLQAGYDTELRDGDGWTPLHAAAHWGVEDACRLLAEHGGGMDSLTHAVRAISDGGAGWRGSPYYTTTITVICLLLLLRGSGPVTWLMRK